MKIVTIQTFIGDDGIVQIQMPKGFRNLTAEVQITVPDKAALSRDEWHAFVDRFYGIQADDPIERPEQLAYEDREVLE